MVENVARKVKFQIKKLRHNFLMYWELKKICKFLRTKEEIDECTKFLAYNGFLFHEMDCKNWDIAHIITNLSNGNLLDMGSSDSYILQNAIRKNVSGKKYGIDFRKSQNQQHGLEYIQGDLTNTKFPNGYFSNITCLSVIEHDVDFLKFSYEVSRLLSNRGRLYLTFDYWEPKIITDVNIYGLKWRPLAKDDVHKLIDKFKMVNMQLVQPVDWELRHAVITPEYHSPDINNSYTFGMLVFYKKI